MSIDDAIYEVFEPLAQGAPGNDASTLRALDAVPGRDTVRQVLDLGVGHGRTTFTFAQALRDAQVTAVEIHAPFVEQMAKHALEAGVANRVHAICGAMENIDIAERSIDLIWAEGSIYVMGIERALAMWRPWLRPGGCIAFSDFVWWTDDRSEEASDFWAIEYPDMASEVAIRSRAEAAGYQVISSFHLSKEAHDAYYVPLEARVAELAGSVDADVVKVLENLRKEIDVVRRFSDEAGYTFFILQRADSCARTGVGRTNHRRTAARPAPFSSVFGLHRVGVRQRSCPNFSRDFLLGGRLLLQIPWRVQPDLGNRRPVPRIT